MAQSDALSVPWSWCHRFEPRQVQQHSFVEIDHEIFSMVIFSPADSRRIVVSSGGRMCTSVEPASVAQSDAHPTVDKEVAGSIPTWSSNILLWRLIMKYFLWSFSLFCWFKKDSCQFLVKECAQVLNRSVRCTSNCWYGDRRFDPHWVRQHSFVEIDHEIFSMVILFLLLIQEGQLSVSGKRMYTSTG